MRIKLEEFRLFGQASKKETFKGSFQRPREKCSAYLMLPQQEWNKHQKTSIVNDPLDGERVRTE